MNTLFLQLIDQSDTEGGARAWLKTDADTQDLGRVLLSDIAHDHADTPAIVFLPTTDCLITTVNANEKQLKQADQTLAWLIEEQTGDDADSLHVIASSIQGDTSTLIAISKALLNQRMDLLRQAGCHAIAILPDLFLLPATEQGWLLSEWEEGRVALLNQSRSGAVVESDLLETLLDAALQERGVEGSLSIGIMGDDAFRFRIQQWADHKSFDVSFHSETDQRSSVLAKTDWLRHPANFLQGAFAAGKKFTLPKVWKIAAAFVAIAFSVQIASEWLNYFYYKQQAKKSQAQAVALYKRNYPNDSRIVNLERQLKAQIQGGGQSDNMLATLTQVAESIRDTGLNTQRMDFTAGSLTLDINAQAMGDLDRLREKLSSQGFQVEIVSANQQGSVIRGRLRIEG